jgi:hypothetical protein
MLAGLIAVPCSKQIAWTMALKKEWRWVDRRVVSVGRAGSQGGAAQARHAGARAGP